MYCTVLGVFVFGFVCLFDNTTRAVRRMTDAIELTDVRFFGQDGAERTPASVSYQLAHEVARLLELRGDFVRASQVLAVALAEEAQRINQQLLGALDISAHPEEFKALNGMLTEQHARASTLTVLRLDTHPPPCLARCLATLARGEPPPSALPQPRNILDAIARRWSLPTEAVLTLWCDFVDASGGAFTLSLPRAKQTVLAGQPPEIAQALWELALLDDDKAQLMSFSDVSEDYATETPTIAAAGGVRAEGAAPSGVSSGAPPDAPPGAPSSGCDAALWRVRSTVEAQLSTASAVWSSTTSGAAYAREGAGGAGGLNFEEYVVLRCAFGAREASSWCLESQLRFLWRLADRDADGVLSRADVGALLALPRARLGWDDRQYRAYLEWTLGALGADGGRAIDVKRMHERLRASGQLRALLSAAEPREEEPTGRAHAVAAAIASAASAIDDGRNAAKGALGRATDKVAAFLAAVAERPPKAGATML